MWNGKNVAELLEVKLELLYIYIYYIVYYIIYITLFIVFIIYKNDVNKLNKTIISQIIEDNT